MPLLKVSPELCDDVKLETEQLSVAVGAVHVTIAVQFPASVDCEIFDGMFAITGFSESEITISKLDETEFPAASVAV